MEQTAPNGENQPREVGLYESTQLLVIPVLVDESLQQVVAVAVFGFNKRDPGAVEPNRATFQSVVKLE